MSGEFAFAMRLARGLRPRRATWTRRSAERLQAFADAVRRLGTAFPGGCRQACDAAGIRASGKTAPAEPGEPNARSSSCQTNRSPRRRPGISCRRGRRDYLSSRIGSPCINTRALAEAQDEIAAQGRADRSHHALRQGHHRRAKAEHDGAFPHPHRHRQWRRHRRFPPFLVGHELSRSRRRARAGTCRVPQGRKLVVPISPLRVAPRRGQSRFLDPDHPKRRGLKDVDRRAQKCRRNRSPRHRSACRSHEDKGVVGAARRPRPSARSSSPDLPLRGASLAALEVDPQPPSKPSSIWHGGSG